MKFRRIRSNNRILSINGYRFVYFILIILILYLLYIKLIQIEINSFEKIEWEGIPKYKCGIPQTIIQTSKCSIDKNNNYTNTYLKLNPSYQYLHYNDVQAEEFVRKRMPSSIYETYLLLPKSVLKADYFRYIVLLVEGGIYTDMDTICLKPIDRWVEKRNLNDIGLIIGIEADASLWDLFQGDYQRQIQFVQWTIAAAPGHPIFYQIIYSIHKRTRSMLRQPLNEKQILEWTGPAIWTDILANYFSFKYQFSINNLKNLEEEMLIGNDIYVLPITAFAPGLKKMGSKSLHHPQAKVQHLFAGTWKNSRKN